MATFGPAIGDAVLEIPVSITGDNIALRFLYRISSLKIELAVRKSKAGKLHDAKVTTTTERYKTGEWNIVYVPLDSDVEAVQLVAKKNFVTSANEYVLVNSLELIEGYIIPTGISSQLHYV